MSKLQEQGTFQTYTSFADIILNNGVVPVPLYLSGNYDLTVQQLDISSKTNVVNLLPSFKAPFFLSITSPNISSSLSNVQGWMFQIPVTTRTHEWNNSGGGGGGGSTQIETQISQRIQQSILPSRQTFASSLSNQFILQFDTNIGETGLNPSYLPFSDTIGNFVNGAIVITWAYKRI